MSAQFKQGRIALILFFFLVSAWHAPFTLAAEGTTGRAAPTLRGDFTEIRPMLKPLRHCREEIEQEARMNSTSRWAPSAAARAQAAKECEATNAKWAEMNREELARVHRQNDSLSRDLARAQARLSLAQADFEAEEKEVARLIGPWKSKLDSSFKADALGLLADNPHLLVGTTIAGPFRLLERRGPDSAVATHANAYVQIEKIPADLALFSDRPFVMIARVREVVHLNPQSAYRSWPTAVVEWIDGADCALATGSAGARAGIGCLPWKGLQRTLGTERRPMAQ